MQIDYTGDGQELSGRIKDVIMDALKRDDYTSYIVDSYFYSIRKLSGRSHIRLTLNYRETLAQTAEVDRQVREVLDRLITPEMNDHQRVKVIHDWIVLRLAYDVGLNRYTAYEALRTGKAVCQGYALLAYKMLNAAGHPRPDRGRRRSRKRPCLESRARGRPVVPPGRDLGRSGAGPGRRGVLRLLPEDG